jgi:hypothetical protein
VKLTVKLDRVPIASSFVLETDDYSDLLQMIILQCLENKKMVVSIMLKIFLNAD